MALLKTSSEIWQVEEGFKTITSLDPRPYYVRYNEQKGSYYLQEAPEFNLPQRVYGSLDDVNLWIKDYNQSSKSIGVLLTGLKGSGKTLELKAAALKAQKPVLIIDTAYAGGKFIQFLLSSDFDSAVIMIDEFEKQYGSGYPGENSKGPTQVDLLSLFDGAVNSKRLFLLSSNSEHVSTYLENRLGRIKYRKHYRSLSPEIIDAVCEDTLKDKTHIPDIKKFFALLGICTYDLLVTLVADVNTLGLTPLQLYNKYNIKPETAELGYEGHIIYKGEILTEKPVVTYTSLGSIALDTEPDIDFDFQMLYWGWKGIAQHIKKAIVSHSKPQEDSAEEVGDDEYPSMLDIALSGESPTRNRTRPQSKPSRIGEEALRRVREEYFMTTAPYSEIAPLMQEQGMYLYTSNIDLPENASYVLQGEYLLVELMRFSNGESLYYRAKPRSNFKTVAF